MVISGKTIVEPWNIIQSLKCYTVTKVSDLALLDLLQLDLEGFGVYIIQQGEIKPTCLQRNLF